MLWLLNPVARSSGFVTHAIMRASFNGLKIGMGYPFNVFCAQGVLHWMEPVNLNGHIYKTNQNSHILNFIGQVRHSLFPIHSGHCLFVFSLYRHHHFRVKKIIQNWTSLYYGKCLNFFVPPTQ